VNVNTPADALRLRAQLEARARGVPHAVALRVTELFDNGIALFEIAAITGLPPALINLILRGAPPGVPK
jgi:hypothetical protein